MPWKQDYTISDERSLADSEVRWPDGARCCVVVTVDLSVASGPEGVTAADLATPEALFGANQGLAALREVLRRHAVRATYAVPAITAHINRDLVRSLSAEGHEIAAHGFRHEDVSGLDRDEERRRIARTTEILTETVGLKPVGWFSLPRQGDRYAVGAVSPNTMDLLQEAGYVYFGNGLADDIPYYSVVDFASRRAL
ncbi:MAG TPA: polysaccharide deacetylase family protein, partial [Stellaceae bacterium]|nr:polysaccharide deacetylase family protein [Stellaceae bacterium]